MLRRKSTRVGTKVNKKLIHERYQDTALVIFNKQQKREKPKRSSRLSFVRPRSEAIGDRTIVESENGGNEDGINSHSVAGTVDIAPSGSSDEQEDARKLGVQSKVCAVL